MEKIRIYTKKVFRIYMILFFILGLYIAYVQVVQSREYMKNPDNPRNQEKILLRGTIYTRDGKILAASRKIDGYPRRVFPMKAFPEPMTGYLSLKYGRGGLEDVLDKYLRAPELSDNLWEYILRTQPGGQDVYLTIDPDLQVEAAKALEDKKGAVVVMDPTNGEILALASTPSFKPALLDDRWKQLTASPDSPFLLRPVNGIYPPGSVFKLFTLASCLEEGLITPDTQFYCSGDYPMSYPLGTYHIREAGGASHGRVTTADALTYSCNISFAQMGLKLGPEKFIEYGNKFGITGESDFILRDIENQFPTLEELTPKCIRPRRAFHLSPLNCIDGQCIRQSGRNLFSPDSKIEG